MPRHRPSPLAGIGVALLVVLVPALVLQSRSLEQCIDAVVEAVASTRAELAEVRRDLHALAERCRLRVCVWPPRRPTNGVPAAVPEGLPRWPLHSTCHNR